MSTGSGGSQDGKSQPGRPAAETPQRVVVRGRDGHDGKVDSAILAATDTAVAGPPAAATADTVGDTRAPAALRGQETDLLGVTLSGRYLVTRKVGQGGMGAVYEATHTLIGKRVAVKVLLEKYAKREAIVQRLEQEARLASSCQNEHIIDITDFGTTEDGRTFVVMEYLEGESLAECLTREIRLPEQRALRIIAQAASALVAAHAKGIVHRDIKPENLFLLRRNDLDFVKVVDFGISKSLRASDEAEEAPRLTQTGMVLGTPLYMSPEQARGDDELDARVDVYALGVIMYEATTGRVPFAGNNYLSVISLVLNDEARPPRELRPELSEELEAIILRAMAKERDERYANATELLTDVTALLDDPSRSTERAKITGPRRKAAARSQLRIAVWLAMIAVVIAAVVTTVVMLYRGGEEIKQRMPAPLLPVPIDAALPPPAPPADAVPEAASLQVTIKSVPPGASITVDGVDKGTSPVVVPIVIHDHYYEVIASLPDYDDAKITFNAYVNRDTEYTIKLKKTPKAAPAVHRPSPPDKPAPSPTPPGGELGGNPFNPGPGTGSGKPKQP